MANLMTGLLRRKPLRKRRVARLKEIGYTPNELSVIMKDRRAAEDFAIDVGASTMEGVGSGAVLGGAIGAVFGLLAIGTIAVLPILGVLVAGPIAGMLAGVSRQSGRRSCLVGWSAWASRRMSRLTTSGLSTGGVVVAVATISMTMTVCVTF